MRNCHNGGEVAGEAGGEVCGRGYDGTGFVEEAAARAEDVAEIVVINDTRACSDGDAVAKARAEVFRWRKGADAGVPGAEFVGGELVGGSVGAGEALVFVGFDAERGDDGVGDVMGCEVGFGGQAGEGVEDATVEAVEELIREEAAPRVRQGWRKASVVFGDDVVGDCYICKGGEEEGGVEEAVFKGLGPQVGLKRRDGRVIVSSEGGEEPGTS